MTTGEAIRKSLVLSIFPGIGLLDRAFEEEGFTVVRGPDVLWGGDIHSFHAPAGVFAGVIGGPPCQGFSAARWLRSKVKKPINLIPEYERVVAEARPAWFVMEEVGRAPLPQVPGYAVKDYLLENRWFGGSQRRVRRISFGTPEGLPLPVLDLAAGCKIPAEVHRTVLASDGKRAGKGCNLADRQHSLSAARLSLKDACRLQGLPEDFLKHAPFTVEGKYRVVGNGVPLFMGRAVARAVKASQVLREVAV